MNEQIYGYISSIVTGLETAQEIYEKEYQCSNSSLFIWQKNIEFYTQWLMEGFLPERMYFPLSSMVKRRTVSLRRKKWILFTARRNGFDGRWSERVSLILTSLTGGWRFE